MTGGRPSILFCIRVSAREAGKGAGAGGLVFVLMHITDIFRIIPAAGGRQGDRKNQRENISSLELM